MSEIDLKTEHSFLLRKKIDLKNHFCPVRVDRGVRTLHIAAEPKPTTASRRSGTERYRAQHSPAFARDLFFSEFLGTGPRLSLTTVRMHLAKRRGGRLRT